MFWPKTTTEDEKIKQLLKSQPDFSFAKDEIKFKLLASLPIPQQPSPQALWLGVPRYAFAAISAVVLIGLTSTLAYANQTLPGNKLYKLNRLQENLALKITPTPELKAQLHVKFINKRARELNQLAKNPNHQEQKIEAVNQSVKNLNAAIESISKTRDRLKTQGNDKSAAHLDAILSNLGDLADTHEQETNEIRMHIDSEELKIKLDRNIDEIREAKNKVRLELQTAP